jgi:phosphatidate cytidylyltransferase
MANTLHPLVYRFFISTIGLSVVFIALYFSQNPLTAPILASFTTAVIVTALLEFYTIAKNKGYEPQLNIGITSTILYILTMFLIAFYPQAQYLPTTVFVLALFTLFSFYIFWGSNPLANVSITTFGIVYLTLPLTSLVSINYFFPVGGAQDGRWWIVYLLAMTFMTNTSAYFFGKTLGKNKLAPYISPKKTWEGAIGGFCIALIASMGFHVLSTLSVNPLPISLSFWESIWLGGILSFLAQLGDLAESLLKRDVGVKDSSRIPGVGGILDIVDSLVFTSPALYLFLKMS